MTFAHRQPLGGYLGAENQAIRVQIVNESSGGKKITWGFDNASPFYRVKVDPDRKTVTMLTEPKDQYHWPLSGQVVEILPWAAVLPNGEKIAEISGHLSKIETSYDPDTALLTLKDQLPPDMKLYGFDPSTLLDIDFLSDQKPSEYYFMRIWNRGTDLDLLASNRSYHRIPQFSATPDYRSHSPGMTGFPAISG